MFNVVTFVFSVKRLRTNQWRTRRHTSHYILLLLNQSHTQVMTKTVRQMLINQHQTNAAIPTTNFCGFEPCDIDRCMTSNDICHCSNIRSSVTGRTYGIIGNIDCSFQNVIYVYQRLFCDKRYMSVKLAQFPCTA